MEEICRNCQFWETIYITDPETGQSRSGQNVRQCTRISFQGEKAASVINLESSGAKTNAFTYIDTHYQSISSAEGGIITKPDFGCNLFEKEVMARMLETI